MAYVTLADRDFNVEALDRLARRMGWRLPEAMGCVSFLLKGVQRAGRVEATREEIIAWTLSDSPRIVDALHAEGYLTGDGTGTYRVRDGARQLKAVSASRWGLLRRREAKKAVESTGHTDEAPEARAHVSIDLPPAGAAGVADVVSKASSFTAGTVREREVIDVLPGFDGEEFGIGDSSTSSGVTSKKMDSTPKIDVNTKHRRLEIEEGSGIDAPNGQTNASRRKRKRAVDSTGKVVSTKTPTLGAPVFEAYRAAFVRRYKTEPLRNAKVNTQVLSIIRDVGIDDASALVVYFVERNDAKYTNAKHPIGLLLFEMQKLIVEMRAGRKDTLETSRRAEAEGDTRDAVRNYLSRQGGRRDSREIS